jgi:hypothetical protein
MPAVVAAAVGFPLRQVVQVVQVAVARVADLVAALPEQQELQTQVVAADHVLQVEVVPQTLPEVLVLSLLDM